MISKTCPLFLFAAATAVMLLQPIAAGAQPVQRLARPVEASTIGADGKLVASENATFGNLVVDQYQRLGHRLATPDTNSAATDVMVELMCSTGSIGKVSAYAVTEALKETSKAERVRLKARDPDAMTNLAVGAIAVLDGIEAEAIRADEAIGPGAYHDAIAGLRFGLEACRFYGAPL